MGEDIIKGRKFYIGEEEVNTDINTELDLPDDVIYKARLEMFKSILFKESDLSTDTDATCNDMSMDMSLNKEGLEELFNTIQELTQEQYQHVSQDIYDYIRSHYANQSDMMQDLSLKGRFIIAVPDDIIKNMLVEMFEAYNINYSDKIQVHDFIDSVYIVDGDKLDGGI